MKSIKTKFILGVMSLFLFSACASISSLQSARTLKKGEWSTTYAMGSIGSKGWRPKKVPHYGPGEQPVNELYFKYGVVDNFDLGLKWSTLSLSVDAKYMLLGKGEPLSLSLGAGVRLTSPFSHVFIPLYISYDFSKESSFHFVFGLALSNEAPNTYYGGRPVYAQVNIGYNIKWLILELGCLTSFTGSDSMCQGIIGFSSAWDDLDY